MVPSVPKVSIPARTVRTLATIAVLLVAVAVPAAAQDEPQGTPPLSAFGETIDVRVVNIEVVVTDKDGVRVTGLGPQDFKLTVDGQPVPIDYFTEVRGGDAVIAAAGETAPVPGLPALAPGERVGTSYLVFIDDFYSINRDRNQVIEALRDQLSMLGRDDRMAVVAFDGRQLEMLSTWSQSTRQLDRALRDAEARPAMGLQRLAERRKFDLTTTGTRRTRPELAFSQSFRLTTEERVFAEQVEGQVQRSVGAATATLRSFAQPPGRKVMLLLSGGWPYSPAVYTVDDSTRALADTETKSGRDLYAPLVDTANLLGYTVYPIDVPGLGGEFDADASRGGQLATGLRVEPEARFADTSVSGSRERERDVQQAFYFVAGETGGRAMINALRLDAVPEVVADTRSYYWIGFVPQRNRDDARHDIEVAVDQRGLKVRSRDGFRDLSRSAETDMAVESALLFGDAPTTGELQVTLGEPQPAGRKTIEVPLRIAIPVDALTVVPIDGAWAAKFELRVAALDAKDRRSEIPVISQEVRFDEQPQAGGVIPYETRLQLRREKQAVVISLTDPIGGTTLTTRVDVNP
jgi:VWFA-related protein